MYLLLVLVVVNLNGLTKTSTHFWKSSRPLRQDQLVGHSSLLCWLARPLRQVTFSVVLNHIPVVVGNHSPLYRIFLAIATLRASPRSGFLFAKYHWLLCSIRCHVSKKIIASTTSCLHLPVSLLLVAIKYSRNMSYLLVTYRPVHHSDQMVLRKYDKDTWTWCKTPGPPTRGYQICMLCIKN